MIEKLTLIDYIKLVDQFNQLTFKDKIIYLRDHQDILTLGVDCNWWVIRVNDPEIEEHLDDLDERFDITNEWSHSEMLILIELLGLKTVDA